MSFDIGWAPDGWAKGNPIGFINGDFRGGSEAALYYKAPFGSDIPEIGAVRFHANETSKVDAWLKWWYGDEVIV